MKQGIVMEIKNKKAIVLTKNGTFEKVSLKNGQHVEIGSEIDVPVSKNYFNSYPKRISTIVAAAAVLVLFFTQYPFLQNSNLAVAAYIGVDINPSIEVGVNEKLNVVEVIPINDDGKIIVDQIDDNYRNKSLSEFIDDTIGLAKADGYLTENKDVLLTTTTINKDAQKEIEEKVNVIKKEIEQSGVVVTTLKGDKNTRKEAKDLGVSTGKYMIYKESKETLTIKETKELSVTQIYEKLDKDKEKIDKETKKEQKADNKQQKFEDKKNDKKIDNAPVKADKSKSKNKNKDSDPSNEPPSKNKVKENKKQESNDDHPPKIKNDNTEKHVDQQQPNKDKKDNKDKPKDNKDKPKDKNNGHKKEN